MTRRLLSVLLCLALLFSLSSCRGKKEEKGIPYWTEDSAAMADIVAYVADVTDPKSANFVPEERRVAVFDLDGTLFGERFPTYFDEWMLIQRLLDPRYNPSPEDREWALSAQEALENGEPEPDSPRSGGQMMAETFRGYYVEELRAWTREFMSEPVLGFEKADGSGKGMTYAEGFFLPMVELVRYLSEHGFTVFISSGEERSIARELISDTLGVWIPPYRVIGSTFSLYADGQGDKEGRKYHYAPEDRVRLEGDMTEKNQRFNKVSAIVNEIGMAPLLVFGNSSGDFSMATYALQHGGRAYMLLCDDTEREYGDPEEAASFAEECRKLGFRTVSMRDEFATIYGENVVKTGIPLR